MFLKTEVMKKVFFPPKIGFMNPASKIFPVNNNVKKRVLKKAVDLLSKSNN